MPKPEAYPFLRIAKKYDIDYTAVLLVADRFQHGGITLINATVKNFAASAEILNACVEQMDIRRGRIDWQTGEPL